MPRHARIDQPGLLQHVIVRGIERRPIFLDDADRSAFMTRLAALLKETGTHCLAWVLLDNHFHLLLRPMRLSLADVMRRLLTGYAVVFNLRHRRAGHLFQNRYKSIVCDHDAYLLELIRYIHLNPVRAGVVADLECLASYRWCGHGELLGTSPVTLLEGDEILRLFSSSRLAARKAYLAFVADGLKGEQPSLSRGGRQATQALNPALSDDDGFDERVLGSGGFLDGLLAGAGRSAGTGRADYPELVRQISGYFRIDPERLALPGKERNLARCKAVLCHLAVRLLGMSGSEVGDRLALSPSAVTRAAKRGEVALREDAALNALATERGKCQ